MVAWSHHGSASSSSGSSGGRVLPHPIRSFDPSLHGGGRLGSIADRPFFRRAQTTPRHWRCRSPEGRAGRGRSGNAEASPCWTDRSNRAPRDRPPGSTAGSGTVAAGRLGTTAELSRVIKRAPSEPANTTITAAANKTGHIFDLVFIEVHSEFPSRSSVGQAAVRGKEPDDRLNICRNLDRTQEVDKLLVDAVLRNQTRVDPTRNGAVSRNKEDVPGQEQGCSTRPRQPDSPVVPDHGPHIRHRFGGHLCARC